jgi:putative DNA primase/helicase
MHGFDANSIGTGKSTLADVVSIIATGRRAGAMTLPSDEEESVKTWLSILRAGDRVVSIDDVERMRPVGGGTLNKVLTQQTFKARLLGTNVEPEVPTSVLVLANGNNLTFAADTVSRAIVARMDAGVEDADRRSFKRDIYSYVPEHRAELVTAALTVLRGYWAAGRPFSAKESRFKEWDRLVRGALLWVGAADPMDTREAMEALDPVRTDRAALIDAMLRCFGKGSRVPSPTAQEIVDRAKEEDDEGQALAAALRPHMGKTAGNITSRSVTAYLKGQRDTITNGYRIRMLPGDGHHTVATFWVEEAKAPEASWQEEMAI